MCVCVCVCACGRGKASSEDDDGDSFQSPSAARCGGGAAPCTKKNPAAEEVEILGGAIINRRGSIRGGRDVGEGTEQREKDTHGHTHMIALSTEKEKKRTRGGTPKFSEDRKTRGGLARGPK